MLKKRVLCLTAAVLLFLGCPLVMHASEGTDNIYESRGKLVRVNEESGYEMVVSDEADLLTPRERESLFEDMEGLSAHGNVMFRSINENDTTAEAYALACYHETFGDEVIDGTLLLVDMDNREVFLFTDGVIYETLTYYQQQEITDNIYRYASDGDYYGCAAEAYREVLALMEGARIAEPMRYISSALLALITACLINFLIVRAVVSLKKPSGRRMIEASLVSLDIGEANVAETGRSKRYSPVNKTVVASGGSGRSGGGFSGGGFSGGGFSGGGHSGGGTSGGGAGHRF